MMVKKPKVKKRRPVILIPRPGWHLPVRITIEAGQPVPAFLQHLIVKEKGT
jgi:hypothetical protein